MGLETRARILGCLLGGALGDALGAPVEGLSRAEIVRTYGARGVRRPLPDEDGLSRISAETQLTLFTAEGLLRHWVRGQIKGITTHTGVTANAYLRWLHTQGTSPAGGVGVGEPFDGGEPGWLQQHSELHVSRNAGATCISALKEMRGLGAPAENDSKGCSAVTRISPVGLFAAQMRAVDDQLVFRYGSDLAGLTHGHPTAKLAAGAFAVLIFRLARGESLDGALSIVKRSLEPHREHDELMHAIEAAEQAGRSGERAADAIPALGRGWVAHEALAIGIFCAMAAVSFADGVAMAVNHDGDSDSTGAITGSLLGAAFGVDDIPGSWLQPLELRDVIAEIADDLYEYRQWRVDGYSWSDDETQRIWRKYPGF